MSANSGQSGRDEEAAGLVLGGDDMKILRGDTVAAMKRGEVADICSNHRWILSEMCSVREE